MLTEKTYGYEKHHSTELLLLLKVVNDLYQSFDKDIPSVLVLLDFAALNTVNHDKLLKILEREVGVEGVALS